MVATQEQKHVAYLTSRYPALSHTFILREVRALRSLGFKISTTTVRQADIRRLPGQEEKDEAASTFAILAAARNPLNLVAALTSLVARPKKTLNAIQLAGQTSRPGLKGVIWQIFYFVEAAILARHLSRIGAEHVHCHFAGAPLTVGLLASRMTGLPISYTLHGPSDLYEPFTFRLNQKTANADFVSCISHYARSQCMLFSNPDDWDKLHIVHCGVHPDAYSSPQARQSDTIDLIFVGRLAAVKGLSVLLSAIQGLRERHPRLRLTIVGDGDERVSLEDQAKGLGDIVEFTGPLSQSEVAARLSQSDIFVLPSFAEGVPVVLMEAMASGLPTIATQVAGVSELVRDGRSGLIVAPGDVAGLSAAISRLAKDEDLRTTFGQAGREIVTEEFDIEVETARLATLFIDPRNAAIRPKPYTPTPIC